MESPQAIKIAVKTINQEVPSKYYLQALTELMNKFFLDSPNQHSFDIEAVCKEGENYVGVLHRVTANSRENKIKVILKIPPQNEARRRISFAVPFFAREILFYETVNPMFEDFQRNKVTTKDEIFNNVPRCYKTLTEEFKEGIIMEDLNEAGFEVFNRFENLTVDHINAVMRTLGKLHALSLSIKDQTPQLMKPFASLKDVLYQRLTDKALSTSTREKLVNRALNVALKSNNEFLIEKVKNLLSNDFCELLKSSSCGALAEPYAVICHGDCYNNNIMFKYDSNGKPINVRLIDWQVMRYSSPVCDLSYFLFVCCSKEVRDGNYQNFMNVYYEMFSKFTKTLGSDPTKVLPREAFDDQLKKFGKFGMLMAILALPFITNKQENLPDIDNVMDKIEAAKHKGEKIDTSSLSCFTHGIPGSDYDSKMLGVIEDMCRLEYI